MSKYSNSLDPQQDNSEMYFVQVLQGSSVEWQVPRTLSYVVGDVGEPLMRHSIGRSLESWKHTDQVPPKLEVQRTKNSHYSNCGDVPGRAICQGDILEKSLRTCVRGLVG